MFVFDLPLHTQSYCYAERSVVKFYAIVKTFYVVRVSNEEAKVVITGCLDTGSYLRSKEHQRQL